MRPHSLFQYGANKGARPPERFFFVTHHSNRKRDKEEEGKEERVMMEDEGVMMAKEVTPPLFLPSYISVTPFSPFFCNNIPIRKYVSMTTFKSD